MKKLFEAILKESTFNENIYDFTEHDPDEVVFQNLIKEYSMMSLDKDEVNSLGLDERNSLQGFYGTYSLGRGVPEVVIKDFEQNVGTPDYKYKIVVYQTLDNERAEELFDEISSKLNSLSE